MHRAGKKKKKKTIAAYVNPPHNTHNRRRAELGNVNIDHAHILQLRIRHSLVRLQRVSVEIQPDMLFGIHVALFSVRFEQGFDRG